MINQNAKNILVLTAKDMLAGNVDLITGCRKICNLRHQVETFTNDPLFLLFRGIESETDHFPIGKVREHCDPDYLNKIDNEKNEYLMETKEFIFQECKKIIEKYGS